MRRPSILVPFALVGLLALTACRSTPEARRSAEERFHAAMAAHYGGEYEDMAEDLGEVWTLYAQVTYDGTTIWQEARLDRFRERYGELPIHLRAHATGPDGELGEKDAELLFLAETLAGGEELDAGALLVIDAIATQVVGASAGGNTAAAD